VSRFEFMFLIYTNISVNRLALEYRIFLLIKSSVAIKCDQMSSRELALVVATSTTVRFTSRLKNSLTCTKLLQSIPIYSTEL
jgi:hypothetical protein